MKVVLLFVKVTMFPAMFLGPPSIRGIRHHKAAHQIQSAPAQAEVLCTGPFGGRVCDSLSQLTWALVLVRGWVGGRGPPPCPRLTVQNELGPGFT